MADIYDELGNPIQLTDERGNPVQLTDEHGHPMHLTGIAATIVESAVTTDKGDVVVAEAGVEAVPVTGIHPHGIGGEAGATRGGEHRPLGEQLRLSSSSSSSSSEDDGQGGRRKKKGLKEKLKEILPGKHKDEHAPQTGSYPVPLTSAAPAPPGTEHHPYRHEHEKKSIMEKIKEKLPGTHHNH